MSYFTNFARLIELRLKNNIFVNVRLNILKRMLLIKMN